MDKEKKKRLNAELWKYRRGAEGYKQFTLENIKQCPVCERGMKEENYINCYYGDEEAIVCSEDCAKLWLSGYRNRNL